MFGFFPFNVTIRFKKTQNFIRISSRFHSKAHKNHHFSLLFHLFHQFFSFFLCFSPKFPPFPPKSSDSSREIFAAERPHGRAAAPSRGPRPKPPRPWTRGRTPQRGGDVSRSLLGVPEPGPKLAGWSNSTGAQQFWGNGRFPARYPGVCPSEQWMVFVS